MGVPEVIELDAREGLYRVRGKLWPVGKRYLLHEHIGSGSYGDVCKATDKESGEIVALKRVADVLCCPMLAKRVLREVCIMRRLQHPFVIRLADVFTCKSTEVESGIDLYIATEFADGGDMYRLKEPLSQQNVKRLTWELLVGMQYLHSCHVWHRDIKSENTLLSSNMTVKICDFGLSRSALGGPLNEEPRTVQSSHRNSSLGGATTSQLGRKVLQRQYTKMVVTPSYRAPEVVMSRGQYTSAIDIWSVGCIFWELLMRHMNPRRPGPPARPLFGVRGEPATPEHGELYIDDGDSPLAEQLDVIFDVIGTPCWKDIESVPSDAWRSYLKRLPGRAGNLGAQMASCDREAVDLLTRMLAFDPARRCTAEEALSHTYFSNFKQPPDVGVPMKPEEVPVTLPEGQHFWQNPDAAAALGLLEKELEQSTHDADGGRRKLEWLLERESEGQQQQHLERQQSALASHALQQQQQQQIQYLASIQAAQLQAAQLQAVSQAQAVQAAQQYSAQLQAFQMQHLGLGHTVGQGGAGTQGLVHLGGQLIGIPAMVPQPMAMQLAPMNMNGSNGAWQTDWSQPTGMMDSNLGYPTMTVPSGHMNGPVLDLNGTSASDRPMTNNGKSKPFKTIIRQGSLRIEHNADMDPTREQNHSSGSVRPARSSAMANAAAAAVAAVDGVGGTGVSTRRRSSLRPPVPRSTAGRAASSMAKQAAAASVVSGSAGSGSSGRGGRTGRSSMEIPDDIFMPRRSPRLRELQSDELPHRKRVALRAE